MDEAVNSKLSSSFYSYHVVIILTLKSASKCFVKYAQSDDMCDEI